PMDTLLREARELAASGVRELLVIAQDTTYYGMDLYGERRLADLLRGLCAIEGLEWVRLHYAYPAAFPDDVVEVLRDEPKMCKYLDIPLQHIADGQLRSMRRGLNGQQSRDLVALLRHQIPSLALRTTMLVGYPGESEADFQELMDFVREARFDRLGVFPYSEQEGTYSAQSLADDVPQEVKEQRAEKLMELQRSISNQCALNKVGGIERVIIDRQEGSYYVGRTQYDSPEVDGECFVQSSEPLVVGQFCQAIITKADDYDLYGVALL
ncbi:MAG: radical SAM protein, partial [Mucinivorans sp.]